MHIYIYTYIYTVHTYSQLHILINYTYASHVYITYTYIHHARIHIYMHTCSHTYTLSTFEDTGESSHLQD